MLEQYLRFMKFLPPTDWKVFCYIYNCFLKVSKNNLEEMYMKKIHIDTRHGTIETGITYPTFFKATKNLEQFKIIEIDQSIKQYNQYILIHPDKINISFDLDVDKIGELFSNIQTSIKLFGGNTDQFIYDSKTSQMLKELKLKIAPMNIYLKWFIKNKISNKAIKNFNIGIFCCNPMISEFKKSFQYSQFLKRKVKTRNKKMFKKDSENLSNELILAIVNNENIGVRLTDDEMELLKEYLSNGKVYWNKKTYILLLEFENLEGLDCKNKKEISNKECMECYENKKSEYSDRIECQFVNIKWKKILDELQDKDFLSENEKQIIYYCHKINILIRDKDESILNEKLLQKKRGKYNG